MVSTRHTQSLTDFRQKATETLDRLNRTGAAEILTVNGQARAVLLAPAVFDELARAAGANADLENIRRAAAELDAGKARDADTVFRSIRRQLRAAGGKRR